MLVPIALSACLAAQIARAANLGEQVNAGILLIQGYTTSLSNDTQTFQGSLPYALQIQIDGVIVHKQIRKTAAAATASDPFGSDLSYEIAGSLLNINATVQDSLVQIRNKKADFGELAPIVLASLYQLKSDTDALGAAIVPKLVEELQPVAPLVQDPLDDGFNSAIVDFGGKGESFL